MGLDTGQQMNEKIIQLEGLNLDLASLLIGLLLHETNFHELLGQGLESVDLMGHGLPEGLHFIF